MSIMHSVWALNAEGLTPPAKLVLILVADAGDQEGRYFGPYDRLLARANMTKGALDEVMAELTDVGIAAYSIAENPHTGEHAACILLIAPEVGYVG